MLDVRQIMEQWSRDSQAQGRRHPVNLNLNAANLARLHALETLYPGLTLDDFTNHLLQAALTEVEAALPYRPGPRVISEDELGNPVYEDIGLTPHFLALTKQIMDELES